jgi:flagellar hook assembly protein FlgD
VSIAIRDADGGTVWTLAAQATSGVNRAEWDVRSGEGKEARPGVYRVEISAQGRFQFIFTERI